MLLTAGSLQARENTDTTALMELDNVDYAARVNQLYESFYSLDKIPAPRFTAPLTYKTIPLSAKWYCDTLYYSSRDTLVRFSVFYITKKDGETEEGYLTYNGQLVYFNAVGFGPGTLLYYFKEGRVQHKVYFGLPEFETFSGSAALEQFQRRWTQFETYRKKRR